MLNVFSEMQTSNVFDERFEDFIREHYGEPIPAIEDAVRR